MGQNITLMGADYSDVPAVILPLTGGGTAEFVDTTDGDALAKDIAIGKIAYVNGNRIVGNNSILKPYVLRPDAELIETYSYDNKIVTDEKVAIPEYVTTATTLKASVNLSPTISLDYANYNYYVVERFLSIPTYSIDTLAKGRLEYSFGSHLYEVASIPENTYKAFVNNTIYGSRTTTLSVQSFSRILYWSSNTTFTTYSTATYGIYQTVTAPSISSSKLTIKSPALGIRGSATYFTSTFWNALTDIRYQYIIEVYRAPINNLVLDGWGSYQNAMYIADCINTTTHKLS